MGDVFKMIAWIAGAMIFGTVALFTVGFGIVAMNPGMRDAVGNVNVFMDTNSASLAEFDTLEDGMTYEQVAALIGDKAGESLRWSYEDEIGEPIDAITYTWTNADESSLRATFHNDKLVSKDQSSLK